MRLTQWSLAILPAVCSLFLVSVNSGSAAEERPNILWISCEDVSPIFPFYGETKVHAPNLDRLAEEGAVFDRAFSSSPVCSPSRSALITGIYATTLGTHQHRSKVELAEGVRCFPAYLRDSGYYCTNNWKTDYNFEVPADAWDENSKKAHWRNRPDKSQPFFAVFNLHPTHESVFHKSKEQFEEMMSDVKAEDRVAAADVTVPPYMPDTPVVRTDLQRIYDAVAEMDFEAGELLKQLDEDGLASNTMVMFFSDHGTGLPRGKRWLYDSGTKVPMIVRWPGHVKPGTRDGELVNFVDFAPTMLSLADVEIPARMQGRVFLGDDKQPEPEYIFATRDRMDETPDMIRSVRGDEFKYIKNFYPERPYDLVVKYAEQTPSMQELRRLHKEGKLSGPTNWFFQERKPVEELYDVVKDPYELNNLAGDSKYADKLNEMRNVLIAWEIRTGDRGLEPEEKEAKQKIGKPGKKEKKMKKKKKGERAGKKHELIKGGEEL